jgi:hypothetical protein
MIYSLADLEAEVLSNFIFVLLQYHVPSYPFCQMNFDDRRVSINDDTHVVWTAPTAKCDKRVEILLRTDLL